MVTWHVCTFVKNVKRKAVFINHNNIITDEKKATAKNNALCNGRTQALKTILLQTKEYIRFCSFSNISYKDYKRFSIF